ncbi:Retrovirus-related Pol polyprotein from transposon RE1 [Vitis vinifera]|uniref:Retrovirus-related Pol polyprotein from transposon RE1 n=1 Tax=Vitis vinifera TaxID=29760 RepID=A0A438HTV1_VITVI|nr:Retrovirus-related Pol polyprotein from transposon RE1 [Vitis vinifera]
MLDPKDSKYAAWHQSDCAVKTWMLNSLEPEIAASVGLASTAKEMWDAIKEMFSNDGNNSHTFSLFQQLVDNKQGERSLPEFFAAYRGIINEFRKLLPLSTDLETQKHQWENLFVCGFLMNLNEQCNTHRSQLLGDSTMSTLQSAFSRLQSVSLTLSSPGVDLEHSAMAACGRVGDTGRSKNRDRLCAMLSNIPKAVAVTIASNGSTSSPVVPEDVIQISKEEYDRLLHSQPSSIASHALQLERKTDIFLRMPSSTLGGDIPFTCLFPDPPLFPLLIFLGVYALLIFLRLVYTRRKALQTPCAPEPSPSPMYSTVILLICQLLFEKNHNWKKAMDEEMSALLIRGTWDLVPLLDGVHSVACRVPMVILRGIKHGWLPRGETHLVCKLKKAIYGLKQSLRAWFDKFSQVVFVAGFMRSQADHSVFVRHSSSGIVGVVLSQRKYATDLLQETSLLGAKLANVPMEPILDLWKENEDFEDNAQYGRLVGKLIYLIVTRPDISKKQTVVSKSSAEAEYRAMAHTTCELIWLKALLEHFSITYTDLIPMHCDNQAAIHIVSNFVFHEQTKHIEVDCHFARNVVTSKKICTPFTPSKDQVADMFTRP